jgi:polar amino acid transport system substrate-binding protein
MLSTFQRLSLSVMVLLLFLFAGQFMISWIQGAQASKPDDTLTIGMIDDTPPFCFYNESNQLVGFNIDMAHEIASRIGKKAHIESVSFNRLTSGLMTRQYDMVILGSITPQRAKVVRYLQPHIVSADVLLVHPKLASLGSIREFKGKPWRIGVYNGTSYIQLLKDLGLESNMVIYPNQRDVFLAFYKHRVDAIIMNEDVAGYIREHLDPTIVILPDKIRTDRYYAFAVHKEDLELWREVNDTIGAFLTDGTFEKLHARWLPNRHKEAS